jgi:hypothetical protein
VIRRHRTGFAALLLLVLIAWNSAAQQDAQAPTAPNAEPYEEGEFPEWARTARRAEIVALGSLPISLLASRLLYTLGRFVVVSIAQGSLLPEYLPPFLAPPNAVPLSREDNAWILVGAVSISGIIAAVDYALGAAEQTDEQGRP